MKTGKKYRFGFFTPFLFIGAGLCAEPRMSARTSAAETTLSNAITLTLELTGISNVAAPDLNIPEFQVQRAGQTQSFQWVNGQTSSLIAFNYILRPLKTGTLQIPPITMVHNGKPYSTEPITVTVHADGSAVGSLPSSDPSAAGAKPVAVPSEGLKPVFMTANVDSNRPFVGQQLLLRIQFLHRPDVRLASQPRYSEPDMTGFIVEPLNQQEMATTLNGTQYQVTEIRYALFPTSDGEFVIGPAAIDVAVQDDFDPFDPNSFFQSFFGRSRVLRLNTRAIPIHVRSLPKNKPAQFSGAVGRYKLNTRLDTTEPEVGKPFNLIVTVEGVGNIKAIKEPALPELNGFKKYETLSSVKFNKEGRFIHGSKEFKTLLIPQVSGQVVIPAIAFSYFNPEQNEFVTESTQEIPLKVKPGNIAQGQPEVDVQSSSQQEASEGIRLIEKDIRFIKQGTVKPMAAPIHRRMSFYIANLLPPLFAFIAFVVKSQAARRTLNASHYRSRKALGEAQRCLKQAYKLLPKPDPIPFYTEIHKGLVGFIADKLDVSALGLSWDEIQTRLATKGVPSDLIVKLKYVLDEADMARFATSSFSDETRATSLTNANLVLNELKSLL